MAKVKEDRSRVTLEIDGKQAVNQLGKLEMEAKQLAIDLKAAKKGTQEYVDTNKKLKETEAQIKNMRQQIGLTGMTMTQLSRYQRELRKEIQNTTTQGTKEFEALRKKLHEVTAELTRQRVSLNPPGSGGFFNGLKGSIGELASASGVLLGIAGAIQTLRSTLGVASEFEQSMSNLSAITGATGEQLQMLEDAARRIGSTTTLSAQQTADAFTIIASKKPELLENNEALIATTEAAITLAEAAGITLPEAADALTNTLNQFGVSADESQRFINVLAAGAKFGAGEIDYLNDAVKRFGPIANEMNVSFEQSVAMMEVFAEKGLESEKAGTQFRNILVKLASGVDETNPAIVGMSTALENLAKQQLTTAELAKMFGNENLVAAQIMINSAARFDELTAKVTGTSAAMEQARTRVDNFKGDMKGLQSITEEYMIVIGGFITNALRPLVQGFTALLIGLRELPKFISENKGAILLFAGALASFNAAQIVSTGLALKDIIVKKAQIVWTTATTVAQKGLNAAMMANPAALLLKSVTLLVSGFALLYNSSEKVRGAVAGIGEVAATVWEIIKETFGNITGGFAKLFAGDIAGGMKDLGKAFINTIPLGVAFTEGKRLAGAFSKGYKEKLAQEKKEIESSNLLPSDLTGALTETKQDDPTKPKRPDDNSDKENLKKKLEDMLEEWKSYQQKLITLRQEWALKELPEDEQDVERIRRKYAVYEEELIKHWENQMLTHEQFDKQLQEIQEFRRKEIEQLEKQRAEKLAKDRLGAEEKIQDALDQVNLDKDSLELKRINEYYGELLDLARKYGLDEADIIKAKDQVILKWQKARNEEEKKELAETIREKAALYAGFGNSAISILEGVAAFSSESNKFQKETAIFRAIVASGQAVAEIVAAFASTSFTPIDLAAKIAAGVGIIMTNIATAKRTIDSAKEPDAPTANEKPNTGRSRPPKIQKKSFYYGGDTGSLGIGLGDQYGDFAGFVHKNEYVIPSMTVSDPYVANLLPAIEQIRQDNIKGFSSKTGGMMDISGLEKKLDILIGVASKWPKEIKGKWVITDLEEAQEEKSYLETRYRAQ